MVISNDVLALYFRTDQKYFVEMSIRRGKCYLTPVLKEKPTRQINNFCCGKIGVLVTRSQSMSR